MFSPAPSGPKAVLGQALSGPADGLTLAVKDMFFIEGHVSSYGHPRWRETHAPSDRTAPVVSRLLNAGASIAGLAKLDQIAWSIIGNASEGIPPLNPAYPDRFTGGSSSGPASAVACGLADVGIGTDTGGSIRVPAAACGLFGLRPTHGRISTDGVLPLAPAFDTVGVLARQLEPLARTLGVLLDGNDAAAPARRLVLPADCLAAVSAETAGAARGVAVLLAQRTGLELIEADLGEFFSAEAADLFARNQGRQVWQALGPWLAENIDVLAADVAGRVRRAELLSAAPQAEQDQDVRAWEAYTAGLAEKLPEGTVAVVPVMPGLTPLRTASADELAEFRASALRFTASASLSGRPELVIPHLRQSGTGPIGAGLLGSRGSDLDLIRLAKQAWN